MAIRIYKPTTNARRNASVNLHVEVTKHKPEKSLLRPLKSTGGRNIQGKVTTRGMGGGEGRSKGGREPASKSGTKAKGGHTRHPAKWSNARIIRRRKSKRYGQLKL